MNSIADALEGRERWCVVEGDCLEVMPTLSGVSHVITDPPYGYRHSSNWDGAFKGEVILGDQDLSGRDSVVNWANTRGLSWLVFGSWKNPAPTNASMALVWDKGLASGMGDLSIPWKPNWEMMWLSGRAWRGDFRGSGVI